MIGWSAVPRALRGAVVLRADFIHLSPACGGRVVMREVEKTPLPLFDRFVFPAGSLRARCFARSL